MKRFIFFIAFLIPFLVLAQEPNPIGNELLLGNTASVKGNAYPALYTNDIQGSFKVGADLTELNAMGSVFMEEGTIGYVQDTDGYYQWDGDSWEVLTFGSENYWQRNGTIVSLANNADYLRLQYDGTYYTDLYSSGAGHLYISSVSGRTYHNKSGVDNRIYVSDALSYPGSTNELGGTDITMKYFRSTPAPPTFFTIVKLSSVGDMYLDPMYPNKLGVNTSTPAVGFHVAAPSQFDSTFVHTVVDDNGLFKFSSKSEDDTKQSTITGSNIGMSLYNSSAGESSTISLTTGNITLDASNIFHEGNSTFSGTTKLDGYLTYTASPSENGWILIADDETGAASWLNPTVHPLLLNGTGEQYRIPFYGENSNNLRNVAGFTYEPEVEFNCDVIARFENTIDVVGDVDTEGSLIYSSVKNDLMYYGIFPLMQIDNNNNWGLSLGVASGKNITWENFEGNAAFGSASMYNASGHRNTVVGTLAAAMNISTTTPITGFHRNTAIGFNNFQYIFEDADSTNQITDNIVVGHDNVSNWRYMHGNILIGNHLLDNYDLTKGYFSYKFMLDTPLPDETYISTENAFMYGDLVEGKLYIRNQLFADYGNFDKIVLGGDTISEGILNGIENVINMRTEDIDFGGNWGIHGSLGIGDTTQTPTHELDVYGDLAINGTGSKLILDEEIWQGASRLYHGSTALNNVFWGFGSGASITTGSYNTTLGRYNLNNTTTQWQNVAIGEAALYDLDGGNGENVAIGYYALSNAGDGSANTAIGSQAMRNATGADNDVAVGAYSLLSNNNQHNVSIGHSALRANLSGADLTAVGYEAGWYQINGTSASTTANQSTYLGSQTRVGSDPAGGEDAVVNETVIGYATIGKGTNTANIGNNAVSKFYAGGGNAVMYGKGVSLTNSAQIRLNNAELGNQEWNGTAMYARSAETLAFGDVCYINSSGQFAKWDADVSSAPAMYLILEAVEAETFTYGLEQGYVVNTSWSFTTGGLLYGSATAGAITQTAPSSNGQYVQVLGQAEASTIIHWRPDLTVILITTP